MPHINLLFASLFLLSASLYADEKNHTRSAQNSGDISKSNIHVSVLSGEPSSFVNQSVNVISGQYHDVQTDLITSGLDSISYQRFYVSSYHGLGGLCHGWNINNFGQVLYIDAIDKKYRTIVWEHGGGCALYEGKSSKSKSTPSVLSINSDDLKKGVTNSSDYLIAGASNIKNNRVYIQSKPYEVSFTTGDGTKRIYDTRKYWPDLLDLTLEQKPNGNQVLYEYKFIEKDDYRISKVKLTNKSGAELSSLSINYKSDGQIDLKTNDNRSATYLFKKYKSFGVSRYYLSQVKRSDGPAEEYEYSEQKGRSYEKLTSKKRPDNRYIINEYYTDGQNDVGGTSINLDIWDLRIGRIKLQKAPVGEDASPIVTHKYFYTIKEKGKKDEKVALGGFTTVLNALNNKTDYHYSEDERLTAIHRWSGTNNPQIYTVERFCWGQNQTKDSTNLLSKSIELGNGVLQKVRSYTYDEYGNVTLEKLWGNISGANAKTIELDANGIPKDNGCQNFTKHYTYSKEGRNLLLTAYDGRKAESYSYYPDTNLVKSKLIWADNCIRIREFFEYDVNGALTKEIKDDGCTEDKNNLSGVSERHIKYITPTTTPVGLPGIIVEKYLDLGSNQENTLGKVVNTYTPQGRLIKQDHYNSSEVYVYTLSWEYDPMGNVTRETNAIGQVIEKTYDANGNLCTERYPQIGLCKEYKYDFSNRLIKMEELHPDGVRLSTSNSYDYLGNKKTVVDAYGNRTYYDYDEFSRLTKTTLPKVLNENGTEITPQLKNCYDPLNRPTQQYDARDLCTSFQYNIYDKPYTKSNPDGTVESFQYNMDGSLKMTTAQNGMITCYTYDYLLRLIKKEILSPAKELLSTFSWAYNAFHLLSETDPSGKVTSYQYDKAGRLVSTSNGNSLTAYGYDDLNRLVKTKNYFGYGPQDFTVEVKVYDLLNRVIEQRIEDPNGNILKKESFGYDNMGNRNIATLYNQNGENTTTTQYNTRGQVISITDALGNKTQTQYSYHYINQSGQRVPYSETTDPMGLVTVNIFDALGRMVNESKKNSLGALIEKHDCYYDAQGNLCRRTDTILTPGSSERTVTTLWTYDSANRLTCTYEAVGTPDQKQTSIGYNNIGQKACLTKSDGTQIFFTYDQLGRLSTLTTSDKSCSYTYEYDQLNNPVKVTDLIQGTASVRSYDENNRLIQETLGTGQTLQYTYDRLGRQTKILFSDGSGVGYCYDQTFLKEVSRLNSSGDKLYSHIYNNYDLSGNILASTLIGSAGMLSYSLDVLGRVTNIDHSQWSSTIQKYDKAGNIIQKSIDDPIGVGESSYAYDPLYQLTEENSDVSHSYQCDSLRNRVNKDGFAYILNHLNQVLGDGIAAYQYDLNGNMKQKQNGSDIAKYTYDALDRLIAVQSSAEQIVYTYDEQNRRISKKVQIWESLSASWQTTLTVYFLYQGLNEIGSCDPSGNLLELRLLGIGKGAEIGAAVAMEFQGKAYAPIHDCQGNVACLIDSNTGKVAEFYRLSAFGEERIFDSNNEEITAGINPWRFSSKRCDEETGLIYFGRRYYDANIGRWITPDPIGFEGGPNLYAYLLNAPLTHVDLYGLLGINREGMHYLPGRDYYQPGYNKTYNGPRPSPFQVAKRLFFAGVRLVTGMKNHLTRSHTDHSGYKAMGRRPQRNEHVTVCSFTGIGCSPNSSDLWADDVGDACNDEVHNFHGGCHGFVLDILECIALMLNIKMHTVKIATQFLKERISAVGGAGSDGIVYVFAHSQGGMILYRAMQALTPAERAMILPITFGSQKLIPAEGNAGARNYVNNNDYVPLVGDPIRYLGARFSNTNVNFLPANNGKIFDHASANDSYQAALREEGYKYKEKYGIN